MADTTIHANALSLAEERDAMEKIKVSGKSAIYEPIVAERDEIRKAMMTVHRNMESRLGQANIQAMYKASGFTPPK